MLRYCFALVTGIVLVTSTPAHAQCVPVPLLVPGQGAGTAIPADGGTRGVTVVTADLATVGLISDLDVEVSLLHTFDADLIIDLVGPAGNSVRLTQQSGGSGDNYLGTIFDDEAAQPLTAGGPPFTGPYRPLSALNQFDGQQGTGQWTLVIQDTANMDSGVLLDWSLEFVLLVGPDGDGDGYDACADCDDSRADVHPGLPELCGDGLDNDCSGFVDETVFEFEGGGAGTLIPADGGTAGPTVVSVEVPFGAVIADVDVQIDIDHTFMSDLTVSVVAPDGSSVTLVDRFGGAGSGFAGTLFDDEAALALRQAIPPYNYTVRPENSLSALDGGDAAGTWHLNILDGIPADSGVLNGWTLTVTIEGDGDLDGDGVATCRDCDDLDPGLFPGNHEICDQRDNDCDGLVGPAETDQDGDGVLACALVDGSAQADCDDLDPMSYPGASEVCDGFDNDCDRFVPPAEDDADEDGFRACAGDCDDTLDTVCPGCAEICDHADNDCNGLADELDGVADRDGDGVGEACDLCLGTQIPEGAARQGLKKGRWALVDGDGVFDTVRTGSCRSRARRHVTTATGARDCSFAYTLEDTQGCSCEQIVGYLLALDPGTGVVLSARDARKALQNGCTDATIGTFLSLID